MFLLKNQKAEKYISEVGGYHWVTSKDKATQFKTYEQAENIRINNLIASLGQLCFVLNDNSNSTIHKGMPMTESIEKIAEQEYENYSKINFEYDLETVLEVLNDLPNKLNNKKKELNNQLIKISRALTDIYHYREFRPKRSASAKCNLDTFETEILEKRRKVKDELLKVECAEERLNGNKRNINLNNRTYTPRELIELFNADKIPKFEEWWN